MRFDDHVNSLIASVTPDGGDCDCDNPKHYVYNDNGQLTKRDASHSGEIEYGYDGIGRMDLVEIPDATGSAALNSVYYAYDAANRITDVTADTHNDVELVYNKANQVTKIDFDNTTYAVDYGYHSTTGRLGSIEFDDAGNIDRELVYGYNNDGLRTVAETRANGVSLGAVDYEYDNLNRLTKESYYGIGPSSCIVLGGTGEVTIDSGGDLGKALMAVTVDMRIYVESLPSGTEAILFRRGTSGDDNLLEFFIDSSGNLKATVDTDQETVTESVSGVPTGQWVHVMCTFDADGNELRVAINEADYAYMSVTGELGAFDGNPTIGKGFDGKIDEVHVRKTATSSFEITENYTANAHTIGLWHFDEGSGSSSAEDDPVEARYVRVWADEFEDNTAGNGIYKLIVTDITVKDSTGTNLSADVAADTIASSHQSASFPVTNVQDANQATLGGTVTHATPEAAPPEWAYVELGSSKEIDEVDVTWQNNGHYIPPHWTLQTSANASTWTDVREFSSYTNPGIDETETVDVHQNAAFNAGVTWGNNNGQSGVGYYEREYSYDKVGNRTSMMLVDEDGSTSRDETWTMD